MRPCRGDVSGRSATLTKMDPLLLSKMEPGGESVLSRFWGLGAEAATSCEPSRLWQALEPLARRRHRRGLPSSCEALGGLAGVRPTCALQVSSCGADRRLPVGPRRNRSPGHVESLAVEGLRLRLSGDCRVGSSYDWEPVLTMGGTSVSPILEWVERRMQPCGKP